MNSQELISISLKARENAYVPYSNFKVGAALLAKNGEVYTGANIESASYTPTCCAERTAFVKAVSEGVKEFDAIAVTGGFDDAQRELCYPCGVCRQVMAEFCDTKTFKIIVAKDENQYKEHTLEEILPFSFGPKDLNK